MERINWKLIPNKKKNIDLLTRSVKYGNPRAPNTHKGESVVVLFVMVPKDKMSIDFSAEVLGRMEEGLKKKNHGISAPKRNVV